jgi:hypothetical protein
MLNVIISAARKLDQQSQPGKAAEGSLNILTAATALALLIFKMKV